ncbi:hypothetical protein BC936DRAFT_141170 [Jimgerdemannia flammicorona]|uniref:Uncharacterized protein n=1 Tax=Jimgerdemannia flammicorona TaxID=994334 RepID=A0A433DG89_9FUNG|nr:hypothetical protein BC936DRAFT_141170 [Jimgerdemannia flammicorona]
MLLSALPKLNDKNTSSIESDTMVIFADCLFHNSEHRRAMTYYERALQTPKVVKGGKKRNEASDNEIRLKYARCCMQVHEYTLAKSVVSIYVDFYVSIEKSEQALDSTHAFLSYHVVRRNSRSSQDHRNTIDAGKLARRGWGHQPNALFRRLAIECYQAILRQQPYAIEAYLALLRHGLSFQQVSQHIPHTCELDWMRMYIEAHANNIGFKYELYEFRFDWRNVLLIDPLILILAAFSEAIESFQELTTMFKHNVDCLLSLSDAHLMMNNTVEAYYLYSQVRCAMNFCSATSFVLIGTQRIAFFLVRKIDPNVVEGMDKYANLIKNQGKTIFVNKIADELHRINSRRPECWLAMALYCEMKDEREKALLFVDKAIALDRRHVEAYQLKGICSFHIEADTGIWHAEAIIAFRKAYRLSKDLFVCRGLAETYLAIPKIKEAMNVAKEALSLMPRNPIALTLVGMVMVQSAETKDKARKAFETALEYDPKCLEPVFALVSMNVQEQKWAESIALLEKYLPLHPTDVMHTRLADVYMRAEDYPKALHHYNAALSLNPDYEDAREGLTRLEKRISTGYDDGEEEGGEDLNDQTMDNEMEEML